MGGRGSGGLLWGIWAYAFSCVGRGGGLLILHREPTKEKRFGFGCTCYYLQKPRVASLLIAPSTQNVTKKP